MPPCSLPVWIALNLPAYLGALGAVSSKAEWPRPDEGRGRMVVRVHHGPPFLHRWGQRVSHSNNIIIHQSKPVQKDTVGCEPRDFLFIVSDEVKHGVVF